MFTNVLNNYRGISLLSIVGKAFANQTSGLLIRLQKLASRVYPESQCGFRAGRSTIDMFFSVPQLQEKCREQGMPFYVAFIDLTKAFDLVSRKGLFRLLEKIGCPPSYEAWWSPSMRTCCVRWFDIGALPCLQRCQARLCPCSNIVWDLLLPPSVICLRLFLRRYLPAHQI